MVEKHPTYGLSAADDPEIIQHLGRIAASWASMDGILVELLCRLLNDAVGEVIYFSLNSFKSRLDVITNIITELMADEDRRKATLLTLLRRINRLNDTRNELIHSAMVEHPDGQLYRSIRRPGRKVSRRHIPVKAGDLEQHGQAVTEVATHILLLINPKIAAEILTSLTEQGHWPKDAPPPSPETLAQLRSYNRPLREKTPPTTETEPPPQPQSSEE
jgi:hypothetical protein